MFKFCIIPLELRKPLKQKTLMASKVQWCQYRNDKEISCIFNSLRKCIFFTRNVWLVSKKILCFWLIFLSNAQNDFFHYGNLFLYFQWVLISLPYTFFICCAWQSWTDWKLHFLHYLSRGNQTPMHRKIKGIIFRNILGSRKKSWWFSLKPVLRREFKVWNILF